MDIDLALVDKWCELLLNLTTEAINLDFFREIIHTCHKNRTHKIIANAFKLADVLFNHLIYGFNTVENQTLCTSSFFAIFALLSENEQSKYFDILHKTFIDSIDSFHKLSQMPNHVNRKSEIFITSLISGIYQKNILCKNSLNDPHWSVKKQIINNTYSITIHYCSHYTHCTFIHFRNLNIITNKLNEWQDLREVIGNYHINILHVVFNNCGNPISGVRDMNFKILSSYIDIIKSEKNSNLIELNKMFSEILQFSWNKAKYCALSAIISHMNLDIVNLIENKPAILIGLEHSLSYSFLVCSGCDLYKTILNKTKSFEDWNMIFKEQFEKILLEKNKEKKKNLVNYWLSTTLKKYPEIIIHLLNNLLNYNTNYRKTCISILYLIKLGRKSGLLFDDWDNISEDFINLKNLIVEGITDIDEDVRSQAIEIVCTSHKNMFPTVEEIELVKQFFVENVNCDSTPFRQSNLNCFTLFLIRIRDSCINNMLKNNTETTQNLVNFFIWLHNFLLSNLINEGNYQRKFFTLNMHDVVLRYLSGGYKNKKNLDKSLCRKGNLRNQGDKVKEFLIKHNSWNFDSKETIDALIKCVSDPTNDIREQATDIIIEYYNENEYLISQLAHIFHKGTNLSNSKLFYENENGCLLLKIVTHFSNNVEKLDILRIITPAKSLHEYYYNICMDQFSRQKNDILLSIYENKPLHGILSVLNATINCTTEPFTPAFLENVLQLIINASDHYIDILSFGAEIKDFPPSFAQMGESIELLAASSAVKYEQTDNVEKLSNIHQLILNNIWLNLKVCCELSLTLINKFCEMNDGETIEKCLQICIDVLTKCRHKGAIEAAGLILGCSVKRITSHKEFMFKTDIIQNILSNFLKETTYGDSIGGSVTRRSAGLTILVHRIVTNDSSHDKHLFYFTMEFLINYLYQMSCNNNLKNDGTDSNERDVPIARALHLLCRTVSESSLSNYIILFAPQLSDVCFNYLSSDEWQIRNAALQLYGALVPKIIGQKLVPNSEIESDSSVTIDELFLHIPSLLRTVKNKLIETVKMPSENIISAHSNLIPMLSLLSSTTKRYPLIHREAFSLFQSVYSNVKEISMQLKILLGSPILIVRNMCAKIISTFYNIDDIDLMDVLNTENEIHGYLLSIKMFIKNHLFAKKLSFDNTSTTIKLESALKHVKSILVLRNNSYYVKILLFEIGCLLETKSENNFICFKNINSKYYPGYFEWQNVVSKHTILVCEENELISKLNDIFQIQNRAILEECVLPILKEKIIDKSENMSNSFLKCLFEYILKFLQHSHLHVGIYELLYLILNKLPHNEYKFLTTSTNHLETIFECTEGKYYQKYLFPLLCCLATLDINSSQLEFSWFVKLTQYCEMLVKPKNFESSSRKMAAVAMKHLIPILQIDNCSNDVIICKQNILCSLIYLLQDEDDTVRYECVKHCNFTENLKHPYHVLLNVLTENFILKVFEGSSVNAIKFLNICLQNTEIDNTNNVICDELQNPFDHNISNIYWEPFLINTHIKKIIIKIHNK